MAATFLDIQNRVKSLLYGMTWDQEQYTYLTSSLNATDLTFGVGDATQISSGLIEIDGELMNVISVNQAANTVTLLPGGRGFYGSVATTHANQATIVNNAKFPKLRVQDAINDCINEVYPELFSVGTVEITKLAVQYEYAMPADTDAVLQVDYEVIGPSKIWPSMRRWRFNPNASNIRGDFPANKAIFLGEEVTPGRTIRVTYVRVPPNLVNDSDGYASVSGLPETSKDAIVYGACAKLVVSYDLARLQQDSVEAGERAANTPPGSASNTSKYFMALYKDRLHIEGQRMRDRYPTYGTQSS